MRIHDRTWMQIEEYLQGDDRIVLPTASIGKILLLVEVAARITARDFAGFGILDKTPGDAIADSGLWQQLQAPALPVSDLAALVGATSLISLRRAGLRERAFNGAMYALSAYAAGEAYLALGGHIRVPMPESFPDRILPFAFRDVLPANPPKFGKHSWAQVPSMSMSLMRSAIS